MYGNERMEEIMADIKDHLLPVIDCGANGNIHHYNRAWEKIDQWFKKYASQPTVQVDAELICDLCGRKESIPYDVGDECYCGGHFRTA